MIPWPLIWALVPKKYLIAAAALVALLLSAVVAYHVHLSGIKDTYYQKGYGRATDSVSAIAIKRIAATETVYVKSAVRSDSMVQAVSRAHPAQHLVIQPVAVPVTTRDSAVRVIVEAFHDTVENVPVRAARYWKQADSTAGLALQSASQWHAAYLASDSLAALWRVRALNVAPVVQHHSRLASAVQAVALVAGTLVLARHVHIKL